MSNNSASNVNLIAQISLESLVENSILESPPTNFSNFHHINDLHLGKKSTGNKQNFKTFFDDSSSVNDLTFLENDIISREKPTFKISNRGASADSEMFILSLTIATSVSTIQPTLYYISLLGDDNNSGTSPTSAWRSLSKANSMTFAPGDQILLEGGSTFTGQLYFDANDQGSATNPITIGSYGGEPATINAGTNTGLFIYNSAGYHLSDLNLVGSGVATNTGNGISFYNDLGGNVKLDGITINNVEVSGFRNYGVVIGAWNNQSGYNNIRVTNVATHDNGKGGLSTYAQAPNANENVYIAHVKAYNNLGLPGVSNPTGNGIVLGNVNNGVIERSIAYNNGAQNNSINGPVGIWTYDSNGIVIQYNESYNNRTGGKADGDGFDLDQNVSNSIMQYNYSHGNDGAGYLLCNAVDNYNHTGNIVRYNISQNDGRKNGYGGIDVYGRIRNAEIYNNTVFLSKALTGSPSAIRVWNTGSENLDVSSLHIRNNILQTTNGLRLTNVSSSQIVGSTDFLFQGNNYYSTGGNFKIAWNGRTYYSLKSWQTATNQEKIGTQNVGLSVNPLFNNPGGGGTINNPDLLNTLDAYRLGSTSPLIDRGLDLVNLFNINPGTQDFWGTGLPQGLGYDIGVDEF
jgi:hypothetical protein